MPALAPAAPAHVLEVGAKVGNWKERLQSIFRSSPLSIRSLPAHHRSPKASIRHYVYEADGERSRVHLRIDPDGNALLLVNASRIVHLNPTAAFMASLALDQTPDQKAIRRIKGRFRVSARQASLDYLQIREQIQQLVRPEGVCPIHDMDLEITAPFSARPSAPYRMDLALTYRCNNDCAHCYNDRPRNYPEMSTQDWIRALDILWEIGIPHVVFTGGEPTLRADLPDLIAHAEHNGQIVGLNTNGRRLSDPEYLDQLVDAGLDHVQITLESHDPQIHDQMVGAKGAWQQTVAGVKNALETPLYVMTNTTLLLHNSPHIEATLDFLGSLGVPTIGLNALIYSGRGKTVGSGLPEAKLYHLLEVARQRTAHYQQRLIWYTPTQYCHFDPAHLDLGVKGCTAALYNMCIEPDGSVIPCQSYYTSLGNLLKDSWDALWNHELCLHLRQRKYKAAKCQDCALVQECGGGCPLLLNEGS